MVISIGFHLLITIVLVLGIPVPLAEGVTTYGGYLWVEALPSNTNGPYYLEDGGQACGRMGAQLASKSVQLADSNGTRLLWNATTLSAVVLELGYAVAPGGISGCCAPGLWCVNGTGGNVVCSTQSFNQLYYNPGWLPLDVQHAYQPVYVCNLPATNASELPPAAIIGAVTPVTTNSTNVAFYIDGTGFGNNSAVITAQIGDTPCSSITPCHATCQQCTPQALCGAGFTCYYFDSLLEPFGYCLQSCGAGLSCGCGGSCVSFGLAGSSSTIDLCVSPNFNDTNQQPCDSFNWGPPAATGLTDRLQCGLPSSHTQCVGVGPQTVAVTVAAVPASPITPFTPNVTLNVSTCVTPSDCGNSSLCFNWACSAGCCVTVPTGRCNSESPLNTGFTGVVLDGNYAPLPPSVATGLDLPVLSTSVDITANVSFYDSGPLDVLQLSFPINMYGYDLYALMLSPNGYVQAKHGFQCPDSATTGVFSSTGCNLQNSYSGVFGPLIANFDPSLTNPAVVLVRYGDGFLCVNWDYMPLYQPNHVYPAGAPVYTTRMCMYTPGAVQWEYFNFTTPPQNYSWMAGVRSPAAHSESALEAAAFATNFKVPNSIAVRGSSDLLYSWDSVTDGAKGGLCSYHTLSCLSPRCGPVGESVTIRWAGAACGPNVSTSVYCSFGGVLSPATSHTDLNGAFITCAVPAHSAFDGVHNLTVPVSLYLLASSTSSSPSGTGIGDTDAVIGGIPATEMSIYSVLSSTVLGANVSGPVFSQASKRATRRGLSTAPALSTLSVRGLANSRDSTDMPRGRSLGSAGASSWRAAVYVSTVMYTYTAGGEICGCDLSPGSTCDPCGVCGGSNSTRDCAGSCFGSAAFDSCGICAGGATRLVPEAEKDCMGVCFGNNTCPILPSPTTTTTTAATIVVIIALSCCLVALFTMCLWFVRVSFIQRQRQIQFELELAQNPPPTMTPEDMQRLELIQYKLPLPDASGSAPIADTCSVCLVDFDEGEEVRKLPCKHLFHAPCIDTWLQRSVVCPMCKVDARSGGGEVAGTQSTSSAAVAPASPQPVRFPVSTSADSLQGRVNSSRVQPSPSPHPAATAAMNAGTEFSDSDSDSPTQARLPEPIPLREAVEQPGALPAFGGRTIGRRTPQLVAAASSRRQLSNSSSAV